MNTTPDPFKPSPEPNNRRNGKVARLPKATRDKINHMILDGHTYNQIIQALGDDAKDLNEDNLSNWKAGGYQDWLRQQLRIDQQQANFEMALDLVRQNAGLTIQKAARQIVAAQICELLLDFDPVCIAAALDEKPEVYTRLINALARISEGESACAFRRAQEARIQACLEQQKPENQAKVITPETLKAIAKELKLL
jgi:hypothetical protein